MARKPGLIGRSTALVGTTLEETETTLKHGLRGVSRGMAILPDTMEEIHNGTREDLLDSKVSLAKRQSQARLELKELGFSDEAIEAIVNV